MVTGGLTKVQRPRGPPYSFVLGLAFLPSIACLATAISWSCVRVSPVGAGTGTSRSHFGVHVIANTTVVDESGNQ